MPKIWRPMHTAPTDGTEVTLWDGRQTLSGRYVKKLFRGRWVDSYDRECRPTNWMPTDDG